MPAQYRSARAKSEIALAELDRLIAAAFASGQSSPTAGTVWVPSYERIAACLAESRKIAPVVYWTRTPRSTHRRREVIADAVVELAVG